MDPPGSTSASRSSSTRRRWLRLLLLAVVGSFNAEVVTYSSSLMNYFSPSFLIFGFGYYAVNIAFIEDLRTRFSLRLRHVLLLGLILGVLEEGWYVKTLTSPQAPITTARA